MPPDNLCRYILKKKEENIFDTLPTLCETWRSIVYAQMPITHLKLKELKKVKSFIEKLWDYCIVFDPLTIETGAVEAGVSKSSEIRVRHNQTAHRDTEWFIPQCDISLAYYVKLVFSAGVPDETVQTSQRGKEAWVIFPGDYSPFIQYRAMPNRIFQDPDEALKALKERRDLAEMENKEEK